MAVSITLKGREIPLVYSTLEMKTVQEEIAPLGEINYRIYGMNPDDEEDRSRYLGAEHLEAMAKLVRILGNAGLEEAGEEPDLTDRKVLRSIKPAEVVGIINACTQAMNEGMASEIPEKKKEGPVDVTLEEISKKKEKES